MTNKITNSDIKKLLTELAEHVPEIDPTDDEWLTFLKNFIAARPNVKIDKTFQKELRAELITRAAQIDKPVAHTSAHVGIWWKLGLTFAGGAAICAAVIVPMMINTPTEVAAPRHQKMMARDSMSEMAMMADEVAHSPKILITNESDDITPVSVENVAKNAFEKIEKQDNEIAEIARDGMIAGKGGGGSMMADRIMISPPFPGGGERINYEYDFEGELPVLPDTVAVFKKSDGKMPTWNDQIQLEQLADLNTFENLRIANISFRQEANDEPWNVYHDLRSGTINFNQEMDWQVLRDEKLNRPTWDDVPNDEELIRTAEKFLANHGVNTGHFGTPSVEKWWEQNDTPRPMYAPEQLTVLFPFEIEGQSTSDQWGNSRGARVTVNFRTDEVQHANIESLNLKRSEYDALSTDEILEQALSGGNQGVTYNNPDKTVTIDLNDPVLKMMEIMSWRDQNRAETYYVPTLIFEVKTEREDGLYFPEKITVPLARDLLAQ